MVTFIQLRIEETTDMDNLKTLVGRFVQDEQGQDLIEYALLATFVSLVAIAGATLLGNALDNWYSQVATNVDGAAAMAS
jgi:pilus assembly protein Flp/PilA